MRAAKSPALPDVPLAALLPPRAHRAILRVAERVRRVWWRVRRPRLRGCAIVAFDDAGRVLMVRHTYRKCDEWQLPTGGVRRGELPEAAARRELAEEVGVEVGPMIAVHAEAIVMGGATNAVTVFAAALTGTPVADGREIAEVRLFDPESLPATTPDWARRYIAHACAERRGLSRNEPIVSDKRG